MPRYLVLGLVTLVVFGVGATACGNGDTPGATVDETTTSVDEAATDAGRSIFTDNCGSCHVLADAGTTGLVGPDLDEASLTVDGVEQQVREGGGQMPAFEGALGDEEIRAVAEYVVEAQRR